MYDWANSAFQTTIIAAVFPIYYQKVAAAGQPEAVAMSRFAWATTHRDPHRRDRRAAARRDRRLHRDQEEAARRCSSASAPSPTAAMFWIERGDWMLALMLFVIGNVGVAGSIVFYESLLPHLVGEDDLDRVSSAGYAIGYLGGGTLLAINLLMIQKPALFGIPDAGDRHAAGAGQRRRLVGRVLDPAVPQRAGAARCGSSRTSGPAATRCVSGVRRLVETFQELRRYRNAFVFLLAFLLYNDGIQTMIRMATIYGTRHRPARERDDHGAAADAVHRRARARSCSAGWRARIGAKTARVRRAGRLRADHAARLLHDAPPRTSSRWRCWSAWSREARRRSADRCSPA